MSGRGSLLLVVLAIGLASAPALASNRIAAGATGVSLKVAAGSDTAYLVYQSHGRTWVVRACCARNARFPSQTRPQVRFRLTYGAIATLAAPGYCGAYDGPALPSVVAGCKAPDGSYWVAQSWPRLLPNLGRTPRPEQAERELRLSHFRGPLPVFTVKQDWAYRGRWDHLYGSLTYLGRPMHGFRTTSYGDPLDGYGVLVYVDTFNSVYGRGWRRENAFVTHRPTGIFCYGFFPRGAVPGTGEAYRATVVGPGVLPDQNWQAARRPYDAAADAAANEEQRRSFSDSLCRPS